MGKVPGVTACSVSLLTNSMGVEGMPGEPADFYLLCGDVTSCCATQIGIVPVAAPESLDPGMFEDTLVTVQGALDIQDDEGYADIRLIDAQVDWPGP